MLEKLIIVQICLTFVLVLLTMDKSTKEKPIDNSWRHRTTGEVDNIRPKTDTKIIKDVKPPIYHGECTTLYTPTSKHCPGPPPKQPPRGGSNVPPKPILKISKRCNCIRPCCKYRDNIAFNCKGEKTR